MILKIVLPPLNVKRADGFLERVPVKLLRSKFETLLFIKIFKVILTANEKCMLALWFMLQPRFILPQFVKHRKRAWKKISASLIYVCFYPSNGSFPLSCNAFIDRRGDGSMYILLSHYTASFICLSHKMHEWKCDARRKRKWGALAS